MNKRKTKTITHIKRKLGMDGKLNRKIEKIEKEFSDRAENVDNFWDLSDFLMLLELAEYGRTGKTKAIIYAFKTGYLAGKWDLKMRILNHFGESGVMHDE